MYSEKILWDIYIYIYIYRERERERERERKRDRDRERERERESCALVGCNKNNIKCAVHALKFKKLTVFFTDCI